MYLQVLEVLVIVKLKGLYKHDKTREGLFVYFTALTYTTASRI